MSTTEHYPDLLTQSALSQNELIEVHRSKISLHHAKTGYDYPTIRLPHTFSRLEGLSTRIYQTVQEGALAFLVVISPKENTSKKSRVLRLHSAITIQNYIESDPVLSRVRETTCRPHQAKALRREARA